MSHNIITIITAIDYLNTWICLSISCNKFLAILDEDPVNTNFMKILNKVNQFGRENINGIKLSGRTVKVYD